MKLKKLLLCFLAVVVMGSMFAVSALADDEDVLVYVDNEKVEFDQTPIIKDGRTLVPVRAVFEKTGAEVTWDQPTQTAKMTRNGYEVTIKLGDSFLYKNGKAVKLDVPASIENDRVLIPVRAISEAMDFGVTWNGILHTVLISTDESPYRAFACWKTGFKDISNAADFYGDYTFDGLSMDINGDGINESVSFTKSLNATEETEPLLTINGVDFSGFLAGIQNTYAVAVVNVDNKDNERQFVVVAGGDKLTAYFFNYNGTILVPVNYTIDYSQRLFFDAKGHAISDMDGVCFTDIMITGCVYVYDDNKFVAYQTDYSKALSHNLYHQYDDDISYWITATNEFVKGSYRNIRKNTIAASDLSQFKLLDMYIDPQNPSYTEFFIQKTDGEKVVITPYSQN